MDDWDWLILGVIIVAAGVAVAWRMLVSPPRKPADPIGPVVIDALGTDWTTRFGWTQAELRAMVASGADTALRRRVDAEVGLVDLKFDATGGSRSSVAVTVVAGYSGEGARSTAHLSLPWDSVPSEVRAELLKGSGSVVFRKWRASRHRDAGSSASDERSTR